MSQENVEVLWSLNDAYRRGDWAALGALLDADIFIRTDPRWPEQCIYGRDAALALYRGLWESGGSDVRIEEIVDLGDRVLVRVGVNMRGHESGVEVGQPVSELATLREGRIIFIEYFFDHKQALKAVGLEE
jgi:ketosteroid isomerase-like protein